MRRIHRTCIIGICILASVADSPLRAAEHATRMDPVDDAAPGLAGRFPHARLDLLKHAGAGLRSHRLPRGPRPPSAHRLTFLEAPEGAWSVPYDINDHGDVSGNVYLDADLSQSNMYFWRHGNAIEMGSYGSTTVGAFQVNNRGQVIVADWFGGTSGALWEKGEFQDLGVPNFGYLLPFDLNDRGEVVGFHRTLTNEARGFHYRNGVTTSLGDGPAVARAINNRGQVVGWGPSSTTGSAAVLWDRGRVTDLGVVGEATDINEAGDIVGWQGELFDRHAFLWSRGTLALLGAGGTDPGLTFGVTPLPGGPFINARGDVAWARALYDDVGVTFESFRWRAGVLDSTPGLVFGINDRGTVVGTSFVNAPVTTEPIMAFIWDDKVTTLELPDGYSTAFGFGINNRGDVIGCAVEGIVRGVVWSPRHRERGLDDHTLAPETSSSLSTEATIVRGDGVRFAVRSDLSGPVRVVILDVTGRVVSRFESAIEPGTGGLFWDGRVEGSPVRSGVYFARVSDASGRHASTRAVVAR